MALTLGQTTALLEFSVVHSEQTQAVVLIFINQAVTALRHTIVILDLPLAVYQATTRRLASPTTATLRQVAMECSAHPLVRVLAQARPRHPRSRQRVARPLKLNESQPHRVLIQQQLFGLQTLHRPQLAQAHPLKRLVRPTQGQAKRLANHIFRVLGTLAHPARRSITNMGWGLAQALLVVRLTQLLAPARQTNIIARPKMMPTAVHALGQEEMTARRLMNQPAEVTRGLDALKTIPTARPTTTIIQDAQVRLVAHHPHPPIAPHMTARIRVPAKRTRDAIGMG